MFIYAWHKNINEYCLIYSESTDLADFWYSCCTIDTKRYFTTEPRYFNKTTLKTQSKINKLLQYENNNIDATLTLKQVNCFIKCIT